MHTVLLPLRNNIEPIFHAEEDSKLLLTIIVLLLHRNIRHHNSISAD
jgi:hypothetical protein